MVQGAWGGVGLRAGTRCQPYNYLTSTLAGCEMSTAPSAPVSFGPEHEEIDRQIAMLHLQWRTYCQLFTKSEERLNLLNDAIPGLAWLMHGLLLDAVMLGFVASAILPG